MRTTEQDTITVYVKAVMEEAQPFVLPKNARVWEALARAGYSADTHCKIRGEEAEPQFFLDDNDVIVIDSKKVVQG